MTNPKLFTNNSIAALTEALKGYVDSHKTCGQHWPDMAEYAIRFNRHHPVMGWSKHSSLEFFLNREDFESWMAEAMLDMSLGRLVAYQGYEWDLGPYPMTGYSNLVDMLSPTEQERST